MAVAPRRRPDACDPIAIGERVASWTRTSDLTAIEAATEGWGEPQWAAARAVTEIHGVGPLLHTRLPERSAAQWPDGLARFREFVRRTYALNQQRAALWLEQLRAVADLARRVNVTAVAMKGAAFVPFLMDDPALRPVADIDLLVEPGGHEPLGRALEGIGYVYERSTGRHHVHFLASHGREAISPLGEDPRNPLRLELHEHARQEVLGLVFDATMSFRDTARPQTLGAATELIVPARHVVLKHVLFHAAQDMVLRGGRLTRLYDIALLADHLDERGWGALVDAAGRQHVEPFFFAALDFTDRYVRPCAPRGVLDTLAAATPDRTRQLIARTPFSSFSRCASGQSNLRRAATMLRWARSRGEQLSMLRRLLWPTRSELEDFFGADRAPGLAWYYRKQAGLAGKTPKASVPR